MCKSKKGDLMIYLDNAATGGFKPHQVLETTQNVIRYLSANSGRSGHRLSITGAEIIYDCRKVLSRLFGCPTEKVIFTKNCTEALNLAILGTLKKGGHVITTVYEHNSVLRPLNYLKENGLITLDIIDDDVINLPREIAKKIKPETYLIVLNTVSNVTGERLPVKEIGKIAKENNLLFLCDGAQGAGHVKLSLKEDGISMLSIAGHKGLYGIMGSGALLIADGVDVNPVLCGGTGTESFNLTQPNCYPEKLESGTLSLPAIASLNEGAKYLENNFENFSNVLYQITENVIDKLSINPNIICYSKPNFSGIVSFMLKDRECGEIADILATEYDIALRSGFHCAP